MIYKKSWNYILVRDILDRDSDNYYRLKALRDFPNVKKGSLGGFVSKFIPKWRLLDLYFHQN